MDKHRCMSHKVHLQKYLKIALHTNKRKTWECFQKTLTCKTFILIAQWPLLTKHWLLPFLAPGETCSPSGGASGHTAQPPGKTPTHDTAWDEMGSGCEGYMNTGFNTIVSLLQWRSTKEQDFQHKNTGKHNYNRNNIKISNLSWFFRYSKEYLQNCFIQGFFLDILVHGLNKNKIMSYALFYHLLPLIPFKMNHGCLSKGIFFSF